MVSLIFSILLAMPFSSSIAQVSNSPPVLGEITDKTEDVNDSITISISATDPEDSDILSFTASGLPTFGQLVDYGDKTADLIFETDEDSSGTYTITVTVTDNGTPQLSDSDTFVLEVHDESLSETEITSDVNDDIVVNSGRIVVITNSATINGSLEVNGGTVIIDDSVTIKGNLESNGGTILIEEGSVIEGNVNFMVSGTGGVLEIDKVEIKGNIVTNGIHRLVVTDSNINGNIFSENDGDVTITGNTVNGNLEILAPSNCSESSNDVNGNNSHCP